MQHRDRARGATAGLRKQRSQSHRSTPGAALLPMILALTLGALAGVGLLTFGYAQGASYFTDDPNACANCHVMRQHLQGWMKSSHGKVAVCNDCHTPGGFLAKYATKALNGFHHSLAFTTGNFPDEIVITQRNFDVANQACLKCHEQVTAAMRTTHPQDGEIICIRCHRNVGHAMASY